MAAAWFENDAHAVSSRCEYMHRQCTVASGLLNSLAPSSLAAGRRWELWRWRWKRQRGARCTATSRSSVRYRLASSQHPTRERAPACARHVMSSPWFVLWHWMMVSCYPSHPHPSPFTHHVAASSPAAAWIQAMLQGARTSFPLARRQPVGVRGIVRKPAVRCARCQPRLRGMAHQASPLHRHTARTSEELPTGLDKQPAWERGAVALNPRRRLCSVSSVHPPLGLFPSTQH